MRLHRLEVQAFGPFAGRESVDLDALATDGVFLLHGPTGAGKTSVLDAVCFALFGRVPGARGSGTGTGTRLRSDHAEPSTPPEVLLEFTSGGRRFEVLRSPAWERPKQRGEGMTTVQARTLLRERQGGEWVALTNRNDEASQLVTDVVGMGLDQFTKVVLLPQGEFAAFLRAPAEERLPLLQNLFGTDRFARVEDWLAERRRQLQRQVEKADQDLDRLRAQIQQALVPLGPDAPSHGEAPDDAEADGSDSPTWDAAEAADLLTAVRALWTSREDTHRDLVAAHRGLARQLQERRDELSRHEQWVATRAQVLRLESEREQVADDRRRLDRARAAQSVAGDLRAVAAARDETRDVQARLAAAWDDLVARLRAAGAPTAVPALTADLAAAEPDEATLASLARWSAAEVARVQDLLATEQETARRQEALAALVRDEERLQEEVARLTRTIQDTETTLTLHEEEIARLGDTAAAVAVAEQAVTTCRAVHEAATRAVDLRSTCQDLRAQVGTATTADQDARQHWLDLRERRLDGMAAELAAGLQDGLPCTVCGSPEHPAPAEPVADHVSADDEAIAREASERAAAARRHAEDALAAAQRAHAVAEATSGGTDVQDAARALTDAETALEAAQADDEALRTHRDAAQRTRTTLTDRNQQHADATVRAAAVGADVVNARRHLAEHQLRLTDATGDHGSLTTRHASLTAVVDAVDGTRELLHRRSACHSSLAAAGTRLATALDGAGFTDEDDAVAHLLTTEQVDALTRTIRDHEHAWAAATARLREPDLVRAAGEHQKRRGIDPRGPHDEAATTGPSAPGPDEAEGLDSATGDLPAGFADAGPDPTLAAAVHDLAAAESSAAQDAGRAATALAVAAQAHDAVEVLVEQLVSDLAQSEPLREELLVVGDLAACVAGTGTDNTLRMRLSSFVLAARLEQVADAASVRLADMTGGRYSLVHTDAAERRGRRSGLGLRVVDAWTGRDRDTTSLSGGESFLASLALALGLADVVQAEAGGTTIETLFVDEGFGTLDDQALDDVMAVLDGLRDGGRAVGLISHVPDLKQRIPSRLEIVRTPSGSHLRAATDAA